MAASRAVHRYCYSGGRELTPGLCARGQAAARAALTKFCRVHVLSSGSAVFSWDLHAVCGPACVACQRCCPPDKRKPPIPGPEHLTLARTPARAPAPEPTAAVANGGGPSPPTFCSCSSSDHCGPWRAPVRAPSYARTGHPQNTCKCPPLPLPTSHLQIAQRLLQLLACAGPPPAPAWLRPCHALPARTQGARWHVAGACGRAWLRSEEGATTYLSTAGLPCSGCRAPKPYSSLQSHAVGMHRAHIPHSAVTALREVLRAHTPQSAVPVLWDVLCAHTPGAITALDGRAITLQHTHVPTKLTVPWWWNVWRPVFLL